MLATFPTYIARAKRGHHALCVVGIEQFETTLAALRVAKHHKTAVGLFISNPAIVHAAVAVAHESDEPVVIICHCTNAETVHMALMTGIGAVSLAIDPEKLDEQELFVTTVVQAAAAHNTGCIIEWPITHAVPEKLIRTGIQGIFLTVPDGISAATLQSRGREALGLPIPVLIEIDSADATTVKQFKSKGFAGYFIRSTAEEAYTSGLRTALRNRSATHPSQYVPYGIKAAEETITNLIKAYTN